MVGVVFVLPRRERTHAGPRGTMPRGFFHLLTLSSSVRLALNSRMRIPDASYDVR